MSQNELENPQDPMCPSGCGTKLVKHKFFGVTDENGTVNLKDGQENFHCPKCKVRWLPELHQPLKTGNEKTLPTTCPSGCGTNLVLVKFVDIFSEDMKDYWENPFCLKCGIRWIPLHHPLKTKDPEKASVDSTTKAEPIEYEQVSIKLPKAVMNLLRHTESVTDDTPEQDIEYAVVESVRSRLESGLFLPTPKILTNQYNLNPVFEAILDNPVEE